MALDISAAQRNAALNKRVAAVMRKRGWSAVRRRIGDKQRRCYARPWDEKGQMQKSRFMRLLRLASSVCVASRKKLNKHKGKTLRH